MPTATRWWQSMFAVASGVTLAKAPHLFPPPQAEEDEARGALRSSSIEVHGTQRPAEKQTPGDNDGKRLRLLAPRVR